MNTNRRDFLKILGSAGITMTIPSLSLSQEKNSFQDETSIVSNDKRLIWANLLHLSTNMWEDHPYIKKNRRWPDIDDENIHKDDFVCKTCDDALAWGMRGYRPFLVFDDSVWNTLLTNMANAGMNMVVIDLGDGVKYNRHPEIAVKNAWTVERLRKELKKMRNMGLEPIPKLNFATSHDTWMGEYSRMVSTKKYYALCKDLINEVIDIFDIPRFFHLGMDEEDASHQRSYHYAVARQHDLWWDDLYLLVNETERRGVRAWVFSDYGWYYPNSFFKKMPKSVLQGNWYYGANFDVNNINDSQITRLKMYLELEKHGFDQILIGSNFYSNNKNMEDTVEFAKNNIDESRLLGFMMTPWLPTMNVCLDIHNGAIQQIRKAKETNF